MSQMIKLPTDTMNRVLQVLAALPYSQVAEVIQEVQSNVSIIAEQQSIDTDTTEE